MKRLLGAAGVLLCAAGSVFGQMSVTGQVQASQIVNGPLNISLIPTTGVSATKLNGTDISTFAGFPFFTAGSPATGTSANVVSLFSGTCSASTYLRGDGSCNTPGGGGTVTSFSAGTLSPLFTTSVATATSTPALSFTLSTAAAHTFLGNNTGSTAAPAYVQPAFTDLSGSATSAQLPTPTTSAIGGVKAYNVVTNQFVTSIDTTGTPASAQPSFANLSGSATSAQLPTPTTSNIGGVKAYTAVSNQFLTSISTTGTPVSAQPSFSDLSGSATTGQMPASVMVWSKYSIPYTAVQTASTTNAVTVVSLTARQATCGLVEKHTTAFAGSMTGLTVQIGDSNGTASTYSPVAFNVMQTVSNTAFIANNVLGMASFAGGTVQANFTASGANLSTLTAGNLDIDICVVTLP